MNRFVAIALVALVAAGCKHPAPPLDDADLTTIRAGFHCRAPRDASETEACRIVDAFANAKAVTDWPAAKEVQTWLGVDHCVTPLTAADYDGYELVYLRAGNGTSPPDKVPSKDVLPYSAVFGANQLKKAALPNTEEALRLLARGERPDPAKLGGVDLGLSDAPSSAFQTLVRAPSGISVGNGNTWYLRSDGRHLLLLGPTISSGCVSELFLVPAEIAKASAQ